MSQRITSRAEAERSASQMPINHRLVVAVSVGAVPWDIERITLTEYQATTTWGWRPVTGYLSDVLTKIGLFDSPARPAA
jgi:hypothetical protein